MALFFSKKQIKTVTELREKTAEVLREVETKRKPLLIVRRSHPAAVLLDTTSAGVVIPDEKVREKELEEDLKLFRQLRSKGRQIDGTAAIRKDRDSH